MSKDKKKPEDLAAEEQAPQSQPAGEAGETKRRRPRHRGGRRRNKGGGGDAPQGE